MDEENQPPAPEEKKPQKKSVWILVVGIIVFLVLLAGGYYLISNVKSNSSVNDEAREENIGEEEVEVTQAPSLQASFTCADGKAIDASFYNEGEFPSVRLVLLNGETISQITLYQEESASGTKYANSDESMVFWNSGDEVYVEENGEETYSDCVQDS